MSLTGIGVYTDKQFLDELYVRIKRGAIQALLGEPDFRTEYECEHGTPLGQACFRDCHLNPVRSVLPLLPF